MAVGALRTTSGEGSARGAPDTDTQCNGDPDEPFAAPETRAHGA